MRDDLRPAMALISEFKVVLDPETGESYPSLDFTSCNGSGFEMESSLEWNILTHLEKLNQPDKKFLADTDLITHLMDKNEKRLFILFAISRMSPFTRTGCYLKWKWQWSNVVEIQFDNVEKWQLSVFLGEVDVIVRQGNIERVSFPQLDTGLRKITHHTFEEELFSLLSVGGLLARCYFVKVGKHLFRDKITVGITTCLR